LGLDLTGCGWTRESVFLTWEFSRRVMV